MTKKTGWRRAAPLCGLGLLAILAIYFSVSGVFTEDENTPAISHAPTAAELDEESGDATSSPKADPPVQTNSNLGNTVSAEGSEFITALVIDNQRKRIGGADVLYKNIPKPDDLECEQIISAEFELAPDTEALQSNSRGEFRIPLVRSSHSEECMLIYAAKQGYAATVVGHSLASMEDWVEIELDTSHLITGKVLSPADEAVKAAEIYAWVDISTADEASRQCAEIDSDSLVSSRSDANGTFSLVLLGDNYFCLEARHSNWASSERQRVDAAKLSADDALSLQLRSPLSVSGRVIDQNDYPVAGIKLQLLSTNKLAQTHGPVTTDNGGSFRFERVDQQDYELRLIESQYTIAKPKSVSLRTGEALRDITVVLDPVSEIRGRVLNERGEGLGGVQVSARSPYLPDKISTTRSDKTGYFRLISEHRSSDVRSMLRMESEFDELPVQTSQDDGAVCIAFYHPDYRADEIAATISEPAMDLGSIHMEAARLRLHGIVKNHRGEGTAADLSIRYLGARDAHAPPSNRCEQSDAPRELTTNEEGEFVLQLNHAGRYEAEVKTERYSTRRLELNLTGNEDVVEIGLD